MISPDHKTPGILIVDDLATNLELARRALERHPASSGHKILEATDGDEAIGLISMYGSSGIRAVLTDFNMHGCDGDEVALAALGQDIPLVYIHTDSRLNDVQKALDKLRINVPILRKDPSQWTQFFNKLLLAGTPPCE